MELPVNSTWVWTNLWVDGNDIIVATSEKNPEDENEYFGKVWRNQHELCSLSMQKYLVLLQPRVVGNNIYAPGYCYCGNDKYKGVIWRNGDVFFSTEGGYCDMIRSVGYYDGCLYYYGSESAPSECFHGKIWKDGEVICDVNEVSWCGYGEINDVII